MNAVACRDVDRERTEISRSGGNQDLAAVYRNDVRRKTVGGARLSSDGQCIAVRIIGIYRLQPGCVAHGLHIDEGTDCRSMVQNGQLGPSAARASGGIGHLDPEFRPLVGPRYVEQTVRGISFAGEWSVAAVPLILQCPGTRRLNGEVSVLVRIHALVGGLRGDNREILIQLHTPAPPRSHPRFSRFLVADKRRLVDDFDCYLIRPVRVGVIVAPESSACCSGNRRSVHVPLYAQVMIGRLQRRNRKSISAGESLRRRGGGINGLDVVINLDDKGFHGREVEGLPERSHF